MHPSYGPPADRIERFVPVLVTNAELAVVDDDLGLIQLNAQQDKTETIYKRRQLADLLDAVSEAYKAMLHAWKE